MATARAFQLEYYDSSLTIVGSARTFAWQWQAAYAAQQVNPRFQEPVGATNLATTPALPPTGAGDLGLAYREGKLGAVTAGKMRTLDLSYTKSSPQLSVDAIGAVPPAATPAPSAPANAATPTTPVAILVILAAGIVVGAIGLWQLRQRAAASRRRGRNPRPPSKPHPQSPPPLSLIHI